LYTIGMRLSISFPWWIAMYELKYRIENSLLY